MRVHPHAGQGWQSSCRRQRLPALCTFMRPTLRQGQVGNRVGAGRGCSPSIPGSCFSSRRPAKNIGHHGYVPRCLVSPVPEDSRAALGPPSTRWVSYRGPSGRHAPALPLHCCHGRSNVGARHRLQGSPRHQFIYTSADASRLCRNGRSPAILTRRLTRAERVFCLSPAYLLVKLQFLRYSRLDSANM